MASADPTLLAYLAGIIDADGTIGIKRSTYGMRHGNGGAPNYSERSCVKQVTIEAINLLTDTFGGSRYIEKSAAKNGRPLNVWQVTDVKAIDALMAIRPFLRIKQKQVDVCWRLRCLKIESAAKRNAFGRGHVGAAKRPPEISEAMEACYLKIKDLNHVGR